MEFFSILFLSVPIFYIWGLISFIRVLTKRQKPSEQVQGSPDSDRKNFLKTAIAELKNLRPDRTIADLLGDYKEELGKLAGITVSQESVKKSEVVAETPEVRVDHKTTPQQSDAFHNWYKDNSINLLLYVGAFLIVVSVTIFVSLETVVGTMKALMVSGLAVLFLSTGLLFSTISKIRNAGTVFAGIGALLIPIAGLSWYKFVVEPMGLGGGGVWFITSVIGLFVYVVFARYFKSVFYSYVTSLSSFSFAFSLVNISGFQNDYYLMAGIISSILLLLLSFIFKINKSEGTELFLTPFKLTAHIVMPLVLVYGIILRFPYTPFTLPITISVFLGSIFYVLSYLHTKIPWHVLPAIGLSSLGLVFFGNVQHFTSFSILLLLSVSVYIDLLLVYLFQDLRKSSEASIVALFGVIKMGLVVFWSVGLHLETQSILCFCALAIIVGVVMALLQRSIYYVLFSSIVTTVLLYFSIDTYLAPGSPLHVLGLSYLGGGLVWYAAAIYWRKSQDFLVTFAISTIFYLFLSTAFIWDHFMYQVINTLVIAGVCISAARIFSNKTLIYLGNLFIAFATINFVKLHEVEIAYYPLIFTALAYTYYLIGKMPGVRFKEEFRNSGLIGMFFTPLLAAFSSFTNVGWGYGINPAVEKNAIISSYGAVIMYSLEAVFRQSSSFGYTASAMGVLTYMWQIHYLGVTTTEYYTVVLGLYFCVLAYLRRKASDQSLRQLFDLLGIGFLIVPTWTQSFGAEGLTHALLLGGIGIGLLAFGITFTRKYYRYSGIIAIVLAVMSQSKWAIIGIAGLGFLGLALYLLLFRKEEK